ncbi:MAG: class I SAM-dependent methyltransferase [Nanoarchaeota archaeon]|nr:class I SAM-dependent methyltransferase [Nanoarchaeota archaeon]
MWTTISESSDAYYGMNQVYEIFSKAEDSLQKIEKILEKKVKGRVLDLGCGSGKFTKFLSEKAEEYIALDKSADQLSLAKSKVKKGEFICSSAEDIPLEKESIDFGVAAWMLGTIPERERQARVVLEIKRVLKKGGFFYLIENDDGGEFEEIRGRTLDKRTKEYNAWLLTQGFTIFERIETCFAFTSFKETTEVFTKIWGENVGKKIKSRFVKHNVCIFVLRKEGETL